MIVLTTLNARYHHCAFGLRYLYAHLNELQSQACIEEFTIVQQPLQIAEQLLEKNPRIIGFGVYIWNVDVIAEVIKIVRLLAPDVLLVGGGPELSYESDAFAAYEQLDHIIPGAAEGLFYRLCKSHLEGLITAAKILPREELDPADLQLPYALYNDTDIAQRTVYVEASRGCPFRCEFCLSALDKTAKGVGLERFLAAMDDLHRRGVRHFKFVDRTFNLKLKDSQAILQFFLDRLCEQLYLHFELIPDRLPEGLKPLIQAFPAGQLQFEIGIQSWNPVVQKNISRQQDNAASEANLRWLREQTGVHLHTDLIVGLPGEDLNSFAQGFDRLYALQPQEIQVGILKRLRGAPIDRHTEASAMCYSPSAPYEILQNDRLDFVTLQRLKRFARYWDMLANSGRFLHSLPLLMQPLPFARFMQLSDWLYRQTQQTHKISLQRLFGLLARYPATELEMSEWQAALSEDIRLSGLKIHPDKILQPETAEHAAKNNKNHGFSRQHRHLRSVPKP